MTTTAYTIYFSDANKAPIIIEPLTVNNDTTLTLFGRDTTSWGQHLNSNFIKLLENFSNAYVPGYVNQVLEGQLWYDSGNKQLKICTDSSKLEWLPLTHIPSPDLTGIVTVASLNKTLNDYVLLTGNENPMTGPLLVDVLDTYSDPRKVATKKYVDSIICSCSTSSDDWVNNYLSDAGGIISTKIILPDDSINGTYPADHAATKKYVNLKTFVITDSASVLTFNNTNGDVVDDVTGTLTTMLPHNATFYKYFGTITIPKTTTATPHVCTCTLPFEFATPYQVVVSGSVLNGADVVGTTNTGAACDVYVDMVSGTEFQIKCTASTFEQLININFFGHKK